MKVSPDSRVIRKLAESIREQHLDTSIFNAVHDAAKYLELVRDAEYRVQDEAIEKEML